MYPAEIVQPMRDELTAVGFTQCTTAESVTSALAKSGTTLVVVNSVCGCAAANARPGARMSLANDKSPEQLITVFAGVDQEATAEARNQMVPFPPSSPSIALFKDEIILTLALSRRASNRSYRTGRILVEVDPKYYRPR